MYIPPGATVVNTEFVKQDNDGSYSPIPAKDTDASYDGWGARGSRNYDPDVGTVQFENGYVNEVQQDSGIFFSTDPRTALVGAGVQIVDPTGVPAGLVYNVWDRDQVLAFGVAGALSGNGGTGNTPLVSIDSGATWTGVGAPVAGADAYYTNDYDPACDGVIPTEPSLSAQEQEFARDVQCIGPWQRIAYSNSKIGGPLSTKPTPIPATVAGAITNTSEPTSIGHDYAVDGPLPSNTNSIRWVMGTRRLGDLELVRFTFEITDPTAFQDSWQNDTFCAESVPGDTSDTAGKDNNWRYYEAAHSCVQLSPSGNLFKQARFVNGQPGNGFALSSGDVLGYEITFTNTGPTQLTNVSLSDTAILDLTLLEPGTANCPYSSYDGVFSGPSTGAVYTAGSATVDPATWSNISTLEPGESVTIFVCGQASGSAGDTVRNQASVTFVAPSGPETLTSLVLSSITNAISGTVYGDGDGNGSLSAGDSGLGGVTVRLYQDMGLAGIFEPGTDLLVEITSTGQDGSYEFVGIAAGNYIIVETDLVDYASTGDIDTDPADCTAGNTCNVIGGGGPGNPPASITIAATGTIAGNDFFDHGLTNTVLGTVFADFNKNGVFNAPTEPGWPGVTVRLYIDENNDGQVDIGDTLVDTTITDANGQYGFGGLGRGNFVMQMDVLTLPVGASLTTDNVETANFASVDIIDANNDFGFADAPSVLELTKTSNASGELQASDFVTYTITPRHLDPGLLTNVQVTDPVPANTIFQSATPAQSSGPDPVVWDLGSNTPGTPGVVPGSALCPATQTLTASQDTFLSSDGADAGNNWGADAKINIDVDKIRHGLVQFNVSALPAGSVFRRADLLMTVESGQNAGREVSVRELAPGTPSPWTEGTGSNDACAGVGNGATWNAPNCTDSWSGSDFGTAAPWGAELDRISPAIDEQTYAADVSTAVSSWLSGGTNNGFVLLADGADTGEVKFHSRTGVTGKEPTLVIKYLVPTVGGCSGPTVLTTVADTYINEDKPDENRGGENDLLINPESGMVKNTLVKFDTIDIPPGATLTSAGLQVTVNTAKNNAADVHEMSTDWTEIGATWNDSDGGGAGDWLAGTFGTSDYIGTVLGTFDNSLSGAQSVTSGALLSTVDGWVQGASPNYGFGLIAGGAETSDAKYDSKEGGTAPTLTVDWTLPPEAGSTVTLNAGGALVTVGDPIQVTMQVESDTNDSLVTPTNFTITPSGGAGAVCSGPFPASSPLIANTPIVFTWTCTASAG
ncbi:MAG: DNRLRE domain-containing protein, partial [Gammaproteobacteria bacterium]|nr:DNRLRE domain-containing protein [Gammaproteobacteria bacterium]